VGERGFGAIARSIVAPGVGVDKMVDSLIGAVSTGSRRRQIPWSVGRLKDATKLAG
jgi:hypothetical protein